MADAQADLDRGRELVDRREWTDARAALASADAAGELSGEDLELLATTAYMLGDDEQRLDALARAHRAHLEEGRARRAARCAFWAGVDLARSGRTSGASGWFARAQRALDGLGEETVESGYLLLPRIFGHEAAGEWREAAELCAEAAEIGRRLGDADLAALAAHERGHVLVRLGEVREGLPLLDEAMVAATAGELSPIVTGIVYCGVILACQEAHDLRRAQEWTAALTAWCEAQPDMVAFTGRCLLHRAELLRTRGGWDDALDEARRAVERSLRAGNRGAAGEAWYLDGEIRRLRGDEPGAEESYRRASDHGRDPQPGRALLRLAIGDRRGAAGAIRAALETTRDLHLRAEILPAAVEIGLATGDRDGARAASEELAALADRLCSDVLQAAASTAAGRIALAAGDPGGGLAVLREAAAAWDALDAPFEAARTRVLVAAACRGLGDEGGAELATSSARSVFTRLGAAAELAALDRAAPASAAGAWHRLTAREVEVLRLVAAGRSNRDIAVELAISEHTVARHVQNIFAKLGVSSRTAASAFAFERGLL